MDCLWEFIHTHYNECFDLLSYLSSIGIGLYTQIYYKRDKKDIIIPLELVAVLMALKVKEFRPLQRCVMLH